MCPGPCAFNNEEMEPQLLLRQILFLFGVGFSIANAKVLLELLQYRRRRRTYCRTYGPIGGGNVTFATMLFASGQPQPLAHGPLDA